MLYIRSILVETLAAAVFLGPIFLVYQRVKLRDWGRTVCLFGLSLYFAAMLSLVGFPNVLTRNFDPNFNLIPFRDLIPDRVNAFLNVLLFVPFGAALPALWKPCRRVGKTVGLGLALTCAVEFSQLFTFRAVDVNDVMTNVLGTYLGYLLMKTLTGGFRRLPSPGRDLGELYLTLGTVAAVMFFLQPHLASHLWKLILT